VLTIDELNTFLSRLGSLNVPIDYGASLPKHVANKKLGLIMKTIDATIIAFVLARANGSGATNGYYAIESCIPLHLCEGLEP
jgi:hypothetical protein